MSHSAHHDQEILDQFSRQAVPFARRHRSDDELMDLLVDSSRVRTGDRVLDVACGPGMVACSLAPFAKYVTGLDFTPAMLAQAAALQAERRLDNIDWQRGSAMDLPFDEAHFDVVVARFSFHHYLEPAAAFREMVRVCKPGGTILVADVAPRADARDAYDALEKHRDPSHTRALTEKEFERLGVSAGAVLQHKVRYDLASDVAGLLASSFPPPGGADAFRRLVEADIDTQKDSLGIRAHRRDGVVRFYFPVLIAVWKKS
jgi:ubiquinone/menaquinone biosynthesis C-methylase UbiE